MSKLVFKPEMFEVEYMATSISSIKRHTDKYESSKSAQQTFDEWLEKQKVVYGEPQYKNDSLKEFNVLWSSINEPDCDKYKAYVVCIEEIKQCEHEPVTFASQGFGEIDFNLVKCRKCGKQLKPKNGWEIAD